MQKGERKFCDYGIFFIILRRNFTLILCVFIPEYVKYQKITY